MSRRAAARRLHSDGTWRAAARLSWRDRTPDESELRRFERFLTARDDSTGVRRLFLWLEHVVGRCEEVGLGHNAPVWVIDSTPMLCFGAVLDTLRFLGDEARSLAAVWAKASDGSTRSLATLLKCPLFLARSTKGHFCGVDWTSPDDRADAVTEIARTALTLVAHIRSGLEQVSSASRRKRLARRCRNLLRKVEQDLESDEQGRLVVAHRVVRDRLVSRTDPEARHARKSKSKVFHGFKLHVLGDAVSGLITSVCVTRANVHDGAVAHRLIGRAKTLRADIEQVLGDTHYGGVDLKMRVRADHGVELLGKPQALPRRKSDRFRKEDFQIDFDAMAATCPAGVTTQEVHAARYGGRPASRFFWPKESCAVCPLRARCLKDRPARRSLILHPREQELRAQRAAWNTPEVQAAYRRRSEGERLIHTMTRSGCRQARAWGLQAAQVQAHVVAIAADLKLLAAQLSAAA